MEKEEKKLKNNLLNNLYFNFLSKNWEPMYDPDGRIFGWRQIGANPLDAVSVEEAVRIEIEKRAAGQNKGKCRVIDFAHYKKK